MFGDVCWTYVSPTLHTCQEKSDHSVARKNDDWWVLTIDWSLIIDDWWLIIDDWWLMIDDWWLMTDIIWNVRYSLPQGGSPLGQTIWGPFHIISVINHQSSIISHQSSIINHQSSMINDQSIVSTHQSSIFSRHAVIPFFLTCMQRRGNVSSTHISKNTKERAQKVIPGGAKTNESFWKSQNDVKKSIIRFPSFTIALVIERKKLAPEARKQTRASESFKMTSKNQFYVSPLFCLL